MQTRMDLKAILTGIDRHTGHEALPMTYDQGRYELLCGQATLKTLRPLDVEAWMMPQSKG